MHLMTPCFTRAQAQGSRIRLPGAMLLSVLLVAPAFAQPRETHEIAARAHRAVLVVRALGANGDTVAVGTGFLVREDGAFVTSFHVVEHAVAVQVESLDGAALGNVSVLAADAPRDLAILRVRVPAAMTPLPLGRDAAARVGDRVYLMSNPLGLNGTFSEGLLSARRPVEGVAMIQVGAPIHPGSSGGPVLNDRGDVIGVATFFANGSSTLGLAVPSRFVSSLLAVARSSRRFERGVFGDVPPQGLVLAGKARGLSRLGGNTERGAPGAESARERGTPGGEPAPVHRDLPRHFETVRALMQLQGFAPSFGLRSALVARGGMRAHTYRLERNIRYVVVAECESCDSIAVDVRGPDTRVLAGAEPRGLSRSIAFTPTRSASYELEVRAGWCPANSCVYTLAIFEPSRPPRDTR